MFALLVLLRGDQKGRRVRMIERDKGKGDIERGRELEEGGGVEKERGMGG